MSNPFKKTLAREILILFGVIGLTLFIGLGVWCYSLVVEKMIAGRTKDIQYYNASITELSKDYDDKFSRIKSFIGLLKTKEKYASRFDYYLLFSTEPGYDKAVKHDESMQSVNGTLPNLSDKATIENCLKPLEGIRLPKGETLTDYPNENVLPIWDCLMSNKEHLFYLIPGPVEKEYKTDTRDKLFKLLEQLQITGTEKEKKENAKDLQIHVTELEKEKNDLSYSVLTSNDLFKIIKVIFIALLTVFYPVRLIYLTFK
jgi:hypothetical protein